MYSRAIVRSILARPSTYNKLAANSSTAAVFQAEPKPPVQGVMQVREDKIVGRDIVGYGLNGEPQYFDSITFPFPSVRFMKNTPEIMALREKEKGDWKKLSIEEKKKLYRASFCQTLVEVDAPTGEWKAIFGWVMVWVSVALFSFVGVRKFLTSTADDPSLSLESRQAQLKRMIDLRVDPIDGLSSNWDYEKNTWKS
ncbi:PREDICTED: cytochrome c oxidase subunit 4 isoform 1, mitochondrial-like [Diuraphis noxia]|uniref:cytochrome c oxidase subunit 4 isoform 1, mitochondrial-like n=1 Tax=Diuraphis noxia TaxID=143948 RepID=UPI0007635ADA|nr:PREDICTED: cytochrome c oxidase subunit 4 isoform 1, mitochondrial-like [Diuraphis noxia]